MSRETQKGRLGTCLFALTRLAGNRFLEGRNFLPKLGPPMGAARDWILSLLQVVVTHNLRQNLRTAACTAIFFAVDVAFGRASLVTAALEFGVYRAGPITSC
jgi:hypothetical protein